MANIRRALYLGLLLVASLSGMAWAQLPVTDDAYVSSAQPTTNNGNNPSLVVQQSSNGTTLMKFDISQLLNAGVSSSEVSKATLKLYTTAVTGQGTFDVYQITSSWTEGTVTYNTRPPMTLITAGGTCPSGLQCVSTASKYLLVDITSLLQSWLNAPSSNYGLALKPNATTISVTLESKESTTTSHAPEVDVVLNTNLSQLQGVITPSQLAAGTYNINISGTAGTAAQFDHITSQCAGNLFATGITTAGNANCAQPTFLQLSGQITNSQLQNSSVNINTGLGLAGGGNLPLGGTLSLSNTGVLGLSAGSGIFLGGTTQQPIVNNAGVLTFNGRSGNVMPANGDYNFSQLFGAAAKNQLPTSTVFADQSNTFAAGFKQIFQSNGTAGINIAGSNTNPSASLAAGDIWFRIDLKHLHFYDGNTVHQVMYTDDPIFGSQINGSISGSQVSGNISGSAANVTGVVPIANGGTGANSASSALTNLGAASTSALASETSARQSAGAMEASARANADATLQSSITAETARAQAAEGTLTTNLNSEISRAQSAEATKADLVTPVQLDNTAVLHNSCSTVNAFVLNVNQPSGQQLFICRKVGNNTLSWELINDDGATTSAANAYTDQQVAAEAGVRQAADSTLQSNINAEAAARVAADSAEATARAAADAAEILARQQADASTLGSANTYTDNVKANILTQPQTFNGNESFSGDNSFSGINTFTNKVDLSTAKTLPVQTTTVTPPTSGNPGGCVNGQMLLQINAQPGQQLFICNNNNDGWVMVNDDTGTTAAANQYTDQQIGAEAALRIAADAATLASANVHADAGDASTLTSANAHADAGDASALSSANNYTNTTIASEAAARIAGDAAALSSANGYTDNAVAIEKTRALASEATKADLTGNNSFTGNQSINGNVAVIGNHTVNGLLKVPAVASGMNQPSNILQFDGRDNSNASQSAQLQALADGSLSFKFGPTAGPISSKLSIAPTGIIAFAPGQTFPGTTTGTVTQVDTGAGLTGGPVTSTGTISLAPSGVVPGTYAKLSVDQYGRATFGTGLSSGDIPTISESQVSNLVTDLSVLSANVATKATAASVIGGAFTKITFNNQGIVTAGSQATSSDLSDAANLVYNNKANVFTGGKQTFAASLQGAQGYASLNFPNSGTTPAAPVAGDMWLTNSDPHLQFQSSTGLKSLAFTTDIAAGTVTGTNLTSGQLVVGAGGSAISTGNLTGEVTTNGGTATALAGTISTAHTFSNPGNSFTGNGAGLTSVNAVTLGGLSSSAFAQLGTNNVFSGSVTGSSFSGNGANLTSLSASNVSAGTLADARLSANVPLLNAANNFTNTTGNTFGGTTTLGNTAAGSGGVLIPPSANGAQKPSFPFDMEATNTGNNVHLFRILAQDGTTPNWNFQFCNSAPCTPTSNGLSIAGSTGIMTFAPGQTFPGTGTGTVTSVATGAGLTGGPITSAGTISIGSGGVTNAMLQNSTLTVAAGTGLSGGGSVALGGSVTLTNAGVTSLTGTANQVTVSGNTGVVTVSLPATINVNTSGNAATATTAVSATTATTANTANNIAAGAAVGGATTWTNVASPSTPAAGKVAVYTDSTSKQLCTKDDTGAVNCVSGSASSASVYTSTGTTPQSGVKFIHGSGTLNSGGNLTITFGTSFTSVSSFDCTASDASNSPVAIGIQNQTANSIKINGTGGHAVSFVCVGV